MRVPGQPGLHSEILINKGRKQRRERGREEEREGGKGEREEVQSNSSLAV
jgi:hypothetical protein